ncbi:hypothetical protein FQG70_22695 [Escherichia coli]|nr:hypothetical protein [Escherichia coli]
MGVLCLTLEEFLQPAIERVLLFLRLAMAGLFHIRATPGAYQKPQSLSGVSLRDGQCDFLCGLVTPGRRLTH